MILVNTIGDAKSYIVVLCDLNLKQSFIVTELKDNNLIMTD